MLKLLTDIQLNKSWCFACIVLLHAACSSRPVVPVVERKVVTVPEQTEQIGGSLVRVVQPGDTLYSIAFSAGVSVNELVAWNGLNHNYQIHVGQKLRLTKPRGFVPRYSAPKQTPVVVSKNNNHRAQKSVNAPIQRTANTTAPVWGWPTKGKIIRNFYPSIGRKGIDILGNNGQSIVAASDGTVVYVGNGLRGYGNLIIIKHSQNFLSAYANNKSILVSQGDSVRLGNRIAEMGKNESGQYALHFQIRKNGKPIDPKPFLLKK